MTHRRLLFALAALLFLWNVWGYDLWAPDEPYFGEGAREMIVDGNWIVPHVNGVVTPDKPPMFFWLIALFSLPFGDVLSFTARLPSALAGLGSLWLVLRLGRQLYNERVGDLAAWLLAATYMFWDKARSAQTDMLLSFFILVALSAFAAFRSGDASPRKAGLLFWAAIAFGTLTKGPVAILLPLGVVVLTLLWDRQITRLWRFAPLSGPLLFGAIIAAWVVPANLWNPELYTVGGALRDHFINRAIHGLDHVQPAWYYVKALPPLLLPWTALVPGALLSAWRRREEGDRLLLVIVVYVVVFFTISTEKRALYVLPSFPAYALLLARLIEQVLEGKPGALSRRWISIPQWITACVVSLLGVWIVGFAGTIEPIPHWKTIAVGLLCVAGGAATAGCLLRGRLGRSVGWTWVGIVATYLLTVALVLPALNPVKSSKAFTLLVADKTAASRAAGDQVVAFWLRNIPDGLAYHSKGMYTLDTNDLNVLIDHLRRPNRVWAVVDLAFTTDLPDDVAERMTIEATARISRGDIALVHNGVEP